MKKYLLFMVALGMFLSTAHAEIKDYVYDGKEIYVHVKKNYLTIVVFPESIISVVRGFGADTYVIQRNDKQPNMLELMPTDAEVAEMSVTGVSGEDYVLRFVESENPYTKLVIHRMAANVLVPDAIVEKQEPKIQTVIPPVIKSIILPNQDIPKPENNLPPQLNLKITLKGNDLPLKVYFSTISQVTGYNIITTPEIETQHTSVNLENIEVWRALKSLLYKFGWGFKVSKEDLIITSCETRIFYIRVPAVEQSFEDETTNESYSNNEDAGTNNTSLNSSSSQAQEVKVGSKITYKNEAVKLSLWDDLENSIKPLITPKTGSYSISRSTGSIMVTDSPGVLDKVAEIIDATNQVLSLQQTFEIQIYEVTLSNSTETGVDWDAVETSVKGNNLLNVASNFSSVGFAAGELFSLSGGTNSSGNNGVTAILKALATQGDVRTISKPKITITNLFPAIIQSVTSIPYISGTGQTISNETTVTNVQTSDVSEGLTMRLDAKISDDQKTVLNISVAENTLDSITSVPGGNGVNIQEPQVSTKSLTTNVEIDPNKTLILGGLISTTKNNSVEGLPYLSRLPWVGGAFSYKDDSITKSELVIVITPKEVSRIMS